MPTEKIDTPDRTSLLEVAAASIAHGFKHHKPMEIDPAKFSQALNQHRTSFVTLKIDGQLRGCIGRLEADGPLVRSVARNGYAAAFQDPRFEPLTEPLWRQTDVHIAVLSKTTPMNFQDEDDLLRQLRPGVDGLVLEAGRCRGTFLPAVWQTLPNPKQFLGQLKVKAGLLPDAWPKDIQISRYTCVSISKNDL